MTRRKSAAAILSDPERIGLAMDFYAPLLTDRCRRALELHFEEDLSLAEIAARWKDARGGKITRQGAQRHIQRGLSEMAELEKQLGLIRRHIKTRSLLLDLSRRLRDRSASPARASAELARLAESL
ncbi:MAG: DNA-binding protein [Candidatus Hydrogenedentota bacterium]